MAHLYSLSIHHYRGIKDLKIIFGHRKFVAIIGRGDSGKTTILKAISAVLSPNWGLNFNDLDFYECKTEEPILIEAVLKEVPDELIKQDKFGLCMGFLKDDFITYDIESIPEDEQNQFEKILTIRLKVTENLEPKWTVVHGPLLDQEVEINGNDRAKLNMYQVNDYIDNHFSYSKGSPLFSLFRQNLSDKSTTEKKILEMVRKSYQAIKKENVFAEFDEVKKIILEQAKGVGLNLAELCTLLEFKENAYSECNITLHSDNIPYRLHGKGSKRLLSIAIQKGLVEDGGIVLIDELEQGLEPDRSRNLARLLKQTEKGQVFITTHSMTVLVEANAENILLLTPGAGEMQTFDNEYQGILRIRPEAFFAKKVICCEGLTEVGIIRAFDDHLQQKRGYGLAVQGIVYINCQGGDGFYRDSELLKKKGYDVCVFADDDTKDLERKKRFAAESGIKMVLCDKGKCIESMLFTYLPWDAVIEMIGYAEATKGHQAVFDSLTYKDLNVIKTIEAEAEKQKVRRECAEMAGKGKWYKMMDPGEVIGRVWFDHIEQMNTDNGLRKEYDELISWVGNDIN